MRGAFVQKSCLKYGSNIYLDRDLYGWYEEFLRCSHIRYLETMVEMREQVSKGNLRQAEGSARLHKEIIELMEVQL